MKKWIVFIIVFSVFILIGWGIYQNAEINYEFERFKPIFWLSSLIIACIYFYTFATIIELILFKLKWNNSKGVVIK